MNNWYSRGNRVKNVLEREFNLKPDVVVSNGHHSYKLIYYMNGNERLIPGSAADSIRETIKEQCAEVLRVTRCSEKRPGEIHCNIVLTDVDFFYD